MRVTFKTSNTQITRYNVTEVHYDRRDGHEEGPEINIKVGTINHIYSFSEISGLTILPDAPATKEEEAICWGAENI